jgi:CRP/FNR family cyclic AMP-dependent transcriptional regulator
MKTGSAYDNIKGVAQRLSGSQLFAYLTSEELDEVVRLVSSVRLKNGGILFREGDEGNELFIVEQGRIAISKIVKGNLEQVLAHMGPGDYFGEMALLEQIPRTATAQAEEETVLLRICREDLFALMERQPKAAAKIMFNLLRTFTNRLQSTNEQLRETVRWGLEATGFQPEE